MATVTQLHNIIEFPVSANLRAASHKGWSYLLSSSLAFNKSIDHAIRIQKPNEEMVPQWIRKLITSGQCSTIYVEDLSLPQHEQVLIKQLCDQYSVSLIGLSVNDKQAGAKASNVLQGPW
ncbi:deoxyguanosinetriphosphate triphosphohydrolase [Aestuariibacter sp. GS-14]|uniref:deoxyguanosinetriphosphate triphosphohydrolase n=1 Tax=Aestuariibacter sp. GS-14 TaxID=2590670 RepID=UPI002104B83A|nr:deoxyguanosinetriphosphate triphosphohydrolase [Aestuariibacter sp. GS-14]